MNIVLFLKKNIPIELIIIIMLGIIIRVIAILNLNIINPDGVVYIQQARSLLSGDFTSIFSCELKYLSLSTVFIAGAYLITGDWIFAAHGTSCLFGSALLIPLAMILRCFFERRVVFLGVATFSVLPIFVFISVNVIKEPVFVFFVTSGLYFFIRYLDEYKKYLLTYSSLCFVLGTWARIEGFFIIPIAAVFIIIYCHKEKFSHLFLFLTLPLLVFFFANAYVINLYAANINIGKILYEPALGSSLKDRIFFIAFEEYPKVSLFLKEAGDQIWLVGVGVVIKNLIKALRYAFFFILILGLKEAWTSLKFDKRKMFLTSVAITGMCFIYGFCLKQWVVVPRFYAGIVLIPLSLFMCYGFKSFLYLLENKFKLNAKLAFLSVVTVVFLVCIPKDLRVDDKDKRVFRDIASEVRKYEETANAVKIATSAERGRWINFYTNYEFLSASDHAWCNKSGNFLWEFFDKDYNGFMKKIEKSDIDYFLWEERFWSKGNFLFERSELDGYFDKIGEWFHPDTGDIVLYKTKKSADPSS